ncbi:YbjN domain-containing protein [Candidatus Bipolaricaulota bacterium]|nr:YbjN domain-containing protein [Candidatus Bipolaricaulota bacterium]
MKRVLAGLCVVPLFLGLLGVSGLGQSILVLSEQCSSSVAHFPAALKGLGLEFAETSDEFDFFVALTEGGPWDLVIVDEYSRRLGGETLDAIADCIAGGRRVYMNYWDWYEETASPFGALWLSDYEEPLPIYVWDDAHPLFTTPNVVMLLQPTADTCIVDGAFFATTEGGVALAGYSPDPAENQAAIIVGNEGRTVLFGGILGLFSGDEDDDGRADGLEFAENVIAFLLATPIVRPWPPLWTAVTPADIDRLLSEMELGFEPATSEEGNPVWVLELAGVPVELVVYTDEEDRYNSLRLSTSWAVSAQTASPLIYAWNLTRRGTRAYANREGGLSLDADLYLVGGVNWRSVWAFIERFEQAITEFEAHLRLLQ